MKDTGFVRKIDELGRVVLPIEVRRTLGMEEKDSIRFYLDEKSKELTLKKERPACHYCKETEDLIMTPNGEYVCKECFDKIAAAARFLETPAEE